MRIVHLTQSTTAEITGGLEYHVKYLTAALQQLGHEVFVVRTASVSRSVQRSADTSSVAVSPRFGFLPTSLRQRLDAMVETLLMLSRRSLESRHGSRVAAQVNRLCPDLVHQHSYIGGSRIRRLLSAKYPIVFTNHTGAYLHLERWTLTRLLQRRWISRFTMAIGPSRELTPRTNNGRYVPNGVDTKLFFPFSKQERELICARHLLAGKRVFLCPRRWAPTKGIIHLATALYDLPRSVRACSVFVFAGNETPGYGRYQRNVRSILAASGCEVRVLGNLAPTTLAELMNIADACLFPSLMEATSLACLEAMACATPVIGTNTGGLPELIRHGENGWLVPRGNTKALTTCITNVCLTAPADLERTGQNAFEAVRRDYTWEMAARRTERVYEEAMDRWKATETEKQPRKRESGAS